MEDAFAALAERTRFHAGDAVLALVGLGYTPVAHRTTMLRRQGERIDDPAFRRRRQAHIVDVLLHIIDGERAGPRSSPAA
jgi:hypothetical protein